MHIAQTEMLVKDEVIHEQCYNTTLQVSNNFTFNKNFPQQTQLNMSHLYTRGLTLYISVVLVLRHMQIPFYVTDCI